jgi:surfeit locus 1 family protein
MYPGMKRGETVARSMNVGKRNWRDLAIPGTVFLLLFPLLLSLAAWQWQRGADKQSRWDEFAAGSREVLALSGSASREHFATLPLYQRIEVHGEYLPAYQVLLDNRPEQGQPGWHVLTPLHVENTGVILLVDRGWLPKVTGTLPGIDITDDVRIVRGRLAELPQPGLSLDVQQAGEGWPKVMQFPTVEDVALQLQDAGVDRPVAGRILWLEPDAKDGFTRHWQPAGLSPERHFAYAFQWFALALTLLVIAVVLFVRWIKTATLPDREDAKP